MADQSITEIEVIDSHTEGEPTRVVIAGGPDLGVGSVAQQLVIFREQFDRFRSAIVNEPRGSDVLVGAMLVQPADPSCAAGVIFFNNVGFLGMCGHGTIGVVATLAHLGRISQGVHRIETPVGIVTAQLFGQNQVAITNVPAYRKVRQALITVPGVGTVVGDVAWGGNWFFLVSDHGQSIQFQNVEQLTDYAWKIRRAVNAQGYPEVDHVELFGPPTTPGARSKNFVLCPGRAYDRCPCGTGTSAKLACLAADGKLAPGEIWVQEGILGTTFTARYDIDDTGLRPTITGRAYINGHSRLLLNSNDPFSYGIRNADE